MGNTVSGRTLTIVIVVILVVAAVSALAWISFQFDQAARQSERHDYSYEIDLSFTTAIGNVTLLLPVPELNGSPVLVQSLVNGTGYGVPSDWELSIAERNGTPMLEITAIRMVPDYRPYPIPIEPGESPLPTTLQSGTEYSGSTPVLMPIHLVATASRNVTIDTRDPVGHEPVFAPGGQLTPVDTKGPSTGYRGTSYTHPIPLYVQYTSDRPATLSFWIRTGGVNSIWRGGWLSNTYSDEILVELPTGTQGWIECNATLVTGEGVYY